MSNAAVYLTPSTGGGSGTIGGSIAADEVAFGSGSNAIAGSANFTFDGSHLAIGVGDGEGLWLTDTGGPAAKMYAYDDGSFNIDALGNFLYLDATVCQIGGSMEVFPADFAGSQANLYGVNSHPAVTGTITSDLIGVAGIPEIKTGASVAQMIGLNSIPQLTAGAVTGTTYGVYVAPVKTSGTTATMFGYWSADLAGIASGYNAYAWFDSQGLFRIKEDNTFNSVGQAIASLYNPQFTKYTVNATNFERAILSQWNSNVLEFGTEAGGTGVLRAVKFIGSAVSTAAVFQAGGYKSSDGSAGATGSATAVNTLTIKNGLVVTIA